MFSGLLFKSISRTLIALIACELDSSWYVLHKRKKDDVRFKLLTSAITVDLWILRG